MTINVVTAFLVILASYGCQKLSENTTTGNPFVSVAITSSAANTTVVKSSIWDLFLQKSYAYPPPASMPDAAGNVVIVNSVWINFGQIEFKFDQTATGSEVDGDSIEFQGVYAINMLSSSPQSFVSGNINIPLMRRVKLKLVKTVSLPSGAPSGFLGKSIFISGTVNGNAFTYSTQDETVIEIAGPTLLPAISNSTLLIELQIANLIKKTNLSAVTATTNIDSGNKVTVTNPCAAIESGASDLYTCFFKGLGKESNLGRDDDGDFVIDLEEASVKD